MPSGVIGISTPEQGRFSVFYAALAGMQRPDDVTMVHARGAVISENRNHISDVALRVGAEWVLYLDDDHILCPDTLTRLLAADKDIISAHYTQRTPPFNPVLMSTELPSGAFLWKQLHPGESGIISVAAAGAGALLVKTKVLEAIGAPYWTLGQISPASWGDDLHFCSRARKAGFEVHVDLDNSIGHIMTGVVWPKRDEKAGWLAQYSADIGKPPITSWLMPLPGDN